MLIWLVRRATLDNELSGCGFATNNGPNKPLKLSAKTLTMGGTLNRQCEESFARARLLSAHRADHVRAAGSSNEQLSMIIPTMCLRIRRPACHAPHIFSEITISVILTPETHTRTCF